MQFSQQTLQSNESAMKQFYRQYSSTFKKINHQPLNRKSQIFKQNLIKSSGVPFNAFNSTNNFDMKNYAFYDKFKNSQAKSIIQKLMQTTQIQNSQSNYSKDIKINNQKQQRQQQQAYLMKQLKKLNVNYLNGNINLMNFNDIDTPLMRGAILLNETENKIFNQIINLITDIQQIKQMTQKQKQDVNQLKRQMKQSGLNWPFQQQQLTPSTQNKIASIFYRYKQQQLQAMFDQNQKLQHQIQRLTKQLTNRNKNQKQKQLEKVIKYNKKLLKDFDNLKAEIRNTGEIDQDEIQQLKMRINSLQRQIYNLEQKRAGFLYEKDQQLTFLKAQNDRLRQQTIQILRSHHQIASGYQYSINPRKQQLIRILNLQQQNRQLFKQQILQLKQHYLMLKQQNQRLKNQRYSNPIQLQSKVVPVRQNQSSFNFPNMSRGKQNYFQNYQSREENKRFTINNENDFNYQNKNGYNYSKFSMKYQGNRDDTNNQTAMDNRLSQYQDFLNKMRHSYKY